METKREFEIRMANEDRFAAWRKLTPDSRLRNRQITLPSPMGDVQPVFCINCGCPQGAVTTSPNLPDVVFICRSCAETHGGLPIPEVPDAEIRARRV